MDHFLLPGLLIGGGAVAGSLVHLSDFFVSLFNVLPTLALLLGGAFCLVYGRQRQCVLLLVVYLGYFLLDEEVDFFRTQGHLSAHAALIFHGASVLLALSYGLFACWEERGQRLKDLSARMLVLGVILGGAFLLGRSRPDGVLEALNRARWDALQADWMSLVQLAYWAFLGTLLVLAVQYARRPRPLHAAQLLGVVGLYWMLPKIFFLPHVLGAMSSMVMLSLAGAVVHEAYLMAYRDELTGLPGRRALNERLQRLGRHYVIAMSDVDHFKQFNDTYGHDVGDQVLRMVAAQLRKVGGGGRVYRYGGEEFTLLFPGAAIVDCLPHLEALRQAVEAYPLQIRDRGQRPRTSRQGQARRGSGGQQPASVTLSFGVAERSEDHRNPEAVIKCADRALYNAKQAGRNRVMVHGESRRGAVRLRGEGRA